jgi:hypothetical protein
MSQQGQLHNVGTGAAAIETLTGNSGGPVGPDASFNINILGNNTTGINVVGSPGTNTLSIVGIQATTSQRGTVLLASDAQAIAGTDTVNALTSSNLTAKLGTQTLHGLPIGAGNSSALTWTAAPTDGQLLIGSTGVDPVLATLTAGSGITITNGGGSISISSAGGVTGPGSSTDMGIATWNGTGGTALNSPPSPLVSSAGIMTNSNQPAFLAYLANNTASVTGDGTVLLVPFDTVSFDQGSNFNTGSNYYVCPVAGLYQYNINIFLAQSAPGTNTYFDIVLLVNGSTPFILYNQNTYPTTGTFFLDANASILIQNAANDQITIQVDVAGNASKNIVIGGGGARYTTLSGYLVC